MEQPAKNEEESEVKPSNAENPEGGSRASLREDGILEFWNTQGIFEKTLKKSAPKGEFVFYDGPPFATGLPHYGHILAGTIKDAIPRYKTMRGYRVSRRWGWDCHGLPLENQIEKELNLATKRDIETLGVAKFNEAARKAVLRYADDWKKIVPRFGRWVDMENDYRTMDATYTESVWWAFKRLYDKGLVYEGFKPMHLCPRCGTTLSNFEVAQGYRDITDISVTVKLPLKGKEKTYLLVWTTTPWTLPGNMAAAVNPELSYVEVSTGGETYIVGRDRVQSVIKTEHSILREVLGKELVGLEYEPPFPYFAGYKMDNKERAWKVYGASYVTMEDGTGLVHLAPAFGAEDLELAQKERIPIVHHVNTDGYFVDAVTDFKTLQAKPKDDSQSTDVAIIKALAAKGLLFAKEKIVHSYPHCWRCDTPLLNYASSSWFVKVTSLKDKLVSENKKIGWIPRAVGENRFGDWLQGARDWAISRARYWGAPIPVWRNPKTKQLVVAGSLDELLKHVKRSGNTYLALRHGEADSNVARRINSVVDDPVHLTEKGRRDIEASASELKKQGGVDHIIASPFVRTRETAEIVRSTLNLPEGAVTFDSRLSEYDHGVFRRGLISDFLAEYPDSLKRFTEAPREGETLNEVRQRMGKVVYELEKKYSGKRILIISHGDPLWVLDGALRGATKEELVREREKRYMKPAELRTLEMNPVPKNADFELDFHRPYIDDLVLVAKDGTQLTRVPDVFDCWFESGSMPYGEHHYPFENLDTFNPTPGWFRKSRGYPADFIAEGLDQTRGWFYSMLVLGVALFGRSPYKHVIVNGIVLAEDGQKMSKRLKNYPDPVDVLERHGADAIRYYMLASPLMRSEDLNFSEKGVQEVASKLIGRIMNVHSFYELYASKDEGEVESDEVLDVWIKARLSETIRLVEEGMETYELDRASRPLMDFVEDMSTWYLRRSRERFKAGGGDAKRALSTTRDVLITFAKVSAPFIPFTAESIFQSLRRAGDSESVHLADWPEASAINLKIIAEMNEVREVVSLGLEARQKAGIKVRQPLSRATTKSKVAHNYKTLVADELNVKEVAFSPTLTSLIELDTALTQELKEEGELRDLIREIQDLRKKAGLNPKDAAVLMVPNEKSALIERHWSKLSIESNLQGKESGASLAVRGKL